MVRLMKIQHGGLLNLIKNKEDSYSFTYIGPFNLKNIVLKLINCSKIWFEISHPWAAKPSNLYLMIMVKT